MPARPSLFSIPPKRMSTACTGARRNALILLCLSLLFFSASPWAQDWSYRVRPGDTLWELGAKYLHSPEEWSRLLKYNDLDEPARLVPGSRLRIPVAWLRIVPAPAYLVSITGEVSVQRSGQAGDGAVAPGSELISGTRIRTGPDSGAVIEFADGSRLRLQADSELILDTLSAYGETGMVDSRMRLQRGRLENRVRRAGGPAASYIIETTPATAAVRGTEFRVATDPESGHSITEVIEGEVEVLDSEQRSNLLAGGLGLRSDPSVGPVEPRPLLPAPELGDLAATPRRSGDRLAWRDLEGAVAWRVLIDSDSDGDRILLDRVVTSPEVILPAIENGDWILRVRAIDGEGMEGLDAETGLTLLSSPEPPFPTLPLPGAVVSPGRQTFAWTEGVEIAGYRFQLATDPEFSALLIEADDLRRGRTQPRMQLPAGHYYWRVASRDRDGRTGPYSDIQHLELREQPESPAFDAGDPGDTVVRWRQGAPGQRYGVQLSRSVAFDNLAVDTVVDEARYSLDGIGGGRWYLRVQSIDADGYTGPFGEPQSIRIGCLPCRFGLGAGAIGLLLILL